MDREFHVYCIENKNGDKLLSHTDMRFCPIGEIDEFTVTDYMFASRAFAANVIKYIAFRYKETNIRGPKQTWKNALDEGFRVKGIKCKLEITNPPD